MDVHLETAALIFGVSPQEVTPEMRNRAKIINHLFLYGAGPLRFDWKVAENVSIPKVGPLLHKSRGLGFMFSRSLLEDNSVYPDSLLPLHLRRLDEGDRLMMKELKMDEQQYRVFLFETENDEALDRRINRIVPETVSVDTESHRGQINESSRLNQLPVMPPPGALRQAVTAAFSRDGTETGRFHGSQLPATPSRIDLLDQTATEISEQRARLSKSFEYMSACRDTAKNTHPLSTDYHSNLMIYHEAVMEYISAVRRYMNEASFSLGIALPPQANVGLG